MARGHKGERAESGFPQRASRSEADGQLAKGKPDSARGPTLKFLPHSGTLCQPFPTPPREPRESPLNLWEQ
jgi:hypothetical protein